MAYIGLHKPKEQAVGPALHVGDPVDIGSLSLETNARWCCISFLRHPGCPFAEAKVAHLRRLAQRRRDVEVVVVTHGERGAARQWLHAVGGLEQLSWVHDDTREIYGEWGLGYTGLGHFASAAALIGWVSTRLQGFRPRSATGTRWQRAGTFVVDRNHLVAWKHIPRYAHELPDLDAALDKVEQSEFWWRIPAPPPRPPVPDFEATLPSV